MFFRLFLKTLPLLTFTKGFNFIKVKYYSSKLLGYQKLRRQNYFANFLGLSIGVSAVTVAFCQNLEEENKMDILDTIRPSNDEYEQIIISDVLKKFPSFDVDSHAVHGTLNKNGLIEVYEVYRRIGHDEILCIIHFGDNLNGHQGIVHGGITSLAFDNTFGWLFIALNIPPAFTANLNINFRKPVFENSTAIMKLKLTETQGRKLYMSGSLEDINGQILADSTSLFIIARS